MKLIEKIDGISLGELDGEVWLYCTLSNGHLIKKGPFHSAAAAREYLLR